MKISFKIFLFLVIILTFITGCSQKQVVSNNDLESEEIDIMGEIKQRETVKVKSVIGNELTVEILQEKEGVKEVSVDKENMDKFKDKENQNFQRPTGGMMGAGFGGMGSSGGERTQDFSSNAMKERMEQRYENTGETKTIIIPVGAPITSQGMGGKNEELDILDISKDSYITILYGDENKEKIVGVQVLF